MSGAGFKRGGATAGRLDRRIVIDDAEDGALPGTNEGASALQENERRVALVSINFAPEITGIGVYSTGLAEYLATRGYRVVVHTAFPYYPQWKKRRQDRRTLFRNDWWRGMQLRRSYIFVPRRLGVVARVLHELSFVLSATAGYIASPRTDVTVIVSPPLFLALPIAVCARLRGSRTLLHVQDLQPDAAVECGMIRRGWLTSMLYRLESLTYRAADAVGSISAGMLGRIGAKGVPQRKLVLLPNWANDDLVQPLSSQTRFRAAWGLDGRFVVLYSGNMGVKQGLSSVLDTAHLLRDRPEIRFVLVGDGGEKEALRARAQELGLDNLQFQPLLPAEALAELLATADVAVVPQKKGVSDIVMPSKVANVMCSARPMIVAATADTELNRIVKDARCGLIVPPEDPAAMAEAILRLHGDPAQRALLGENGRAYVERKLSSMGVLSGFESWLRSWSLQRRSSSALNSRA
jgi:colanic acid biosynthesis glycosyl transferase WcaI